tara:strand:- start:14010 stop:15359 length:1350 start_codon:yes stop_codon:yes gene_type:complete
MILLYEKFNGDEKKGLSYEEMSDKTKHFYDTYCRDGKLIPIDQVINNKIIKAWSTELDCEVLVNINSIVKGGWVRTQSVINKSEYFIKRFKKVHGDLYDYSKVDYKSKSNVIIRCSIHGYFKQMPETHLKGSGCPKCASKKSAANNTLNTDEYIKRAKKVHGDTYNYSKVNYKGQVNITIGCPVHGYFKQMPATHLKGSGCPKCGLIKIGNSNRSNTDEYIEKAKKVHGDLYDYSKLDYKNKRTKITIGCSVHGYFTQRPSDHLNGSKCSKCAHGDANKKKRISTEDFIKKSKEIHRGLYDYSKTNYESGKKVIIKCKIHGDFRQEVGAHLRGSGCPKCRRSKGEILISNYLKKNKILFSIERKFRDCKSTRPLPFDFYLKKYNLCIEYDGRQHFEPIKYFGGDKQLKNTQNNDKIKNDYCKKEGIKLIRIPYFKRNNITEILDEFFNI